eukprot:CAMPEP_0175059870 /NCGR_PEP_ID=MMETSP0052_2-20121109/12675_1 /TAXON_ID=51329 ORGANISM="Polytomella parva, Strain SAG 63-3" /NCGR_SAMPLE_ID=MMETSP0052_2 /ASSEMBLY_ACC=CAM_ASM_000194 /LENGTH=286 /DNA_ID=CAMNT_0016325473 /DNA_START=257 /DNA_END=1114 /DNA_ORIENTATION=+
MALSKGAFDHIYEHAKRRFLVRAELDSRDDAYRWVMHWLSQHPTFRKSQHVSVSTSLSSFGWSADTTADDSDRLASRIMYLPAPGDHVLRFKGRWLWLSRRRPTGTTSGHQGRMMVETLQVTTYGTSRRLLEELVEAARDRYELSSRQRTQIYSVSMEGYWTQAGSRPIRPMSSVVLPAGQAEALLADCREFLGSEAWYARHGIPYRRGYLLYGAPGTGKTSLVTALAGDLQLDVYVISLSSPTMSDETLRNLLNTAATRCILLLEDVDAAFVGRTAAGLVTGEGR